MTEPAYWLIIHHDGAVHIWPIGDPDDDRRDHLIMAARTSVAFPVGDVWRHGDPGTTIMLTGSKPHPKLIQRAVTHELAELERIDPAEVDRYRTACRDATRTARMDSARRVLAGLPADELAAIIGEHTVPPKPQGTGSGTR